MTGFTDTRAEWRPKNSEIPTQPGVYRFSDVQGRVLYIGKAKSLRNRLLNYFGQMDRLAPRTQRMLQLARGVDWTVVGTDTESLILEHTWINEFSPPFNVQFRDDKSYPYLAVTLGDEAPRLVMTRNRRYKGAKYYGPYPKVWAIKQLMSALQQAFPIRTCNDADYNRAMRSGRPCLGGQIGRCFGPCSKLVTVEEHRARINQLVAFLNGQDKGFIRRLEDEMRTAALDQEYERAAEVRDQIEGARLALEQNVMVLGEGEDLDVFGFAMDDLSAAVHMFIVRDGRIRGEHAWVVDVELDNTMGRLAEFALQSAYDLESVPPTILVPAIPESAKELVTALSDHRPRGGKVNVLVPERGEKKQLLDRANLNAGEQLIRYNMRRAADIVTRTDALGEIQAALGLAEAPLRIECIDVSHLQGTNVVASLVVFEDGMPAKNEYRKYSIEETTDDTDSIYQVVKRRAKRIVEYLESDGIEGAQARRQVPQLIVVDGGQPQVNAAYRALTEEGLTSVGVCGLAKRMEELWLPDDPFPVILPRSSEALFLLQRLRDEAHRVAITYQRAKRKRDIHTQLSEVPGLGPKRTKQLLSHFGSVKRLRAAGAEEIATIPGFSETLARAISEHLADVHNPAESGILNAANNTPGAEEK
ncbi:excinuclease ABC subunit UvrC [Leucobacter sp. UCMA 4100]|uniref:excinuclease ABC subunit UvrC n=1 Tax=Leucobacter sp. UCMA 4100 TaxID=2810534 RepID=UPI0022EB1871|nr:excinuclease ABC subunit UvrC [Leucobacter sp. UCMA 4100]MDA3148279.1 excinuclease ABC subunit UvrC [Leucobacter sp. UCMA 4100]